MKNTIFVVILCTLTMASAAFSETAYVKSRLGGTKYVGDVSQDAAEKYVQDVATAIDSTLSSHSDKIQKIYFQISNGHVVAILQDGATGGMQDAWEIAKEFAHRHVDVNGVSFMDPTESYRTFGRTYTRDYGGRSRHWQLKGYSVSKDVLTSRP